MLKKHEEILKKKESSADKTGIWGFFSKSYNSVNESYTEDRILTYDKFLSILQASIKRKNSPKAKIEELQKKKRELGGYLMFDLEKIEDPHKRQQQKMLIKDKINDIDIEIKNLEMDL